MVENGLVVFKVSQPLKLCSPQVAKFKKIPWPFQCRVKSAFSLQTNCYRIKCMKYYLHIHMQLLLDYSDDEKKSEKVAQHWHCCKEFAAAKFYASMSFITSAIPNCVSLQKIWLKSKLPSSSYLLFCYASCSFWAV